MGLLSLSWLKFASLILAFVVFGSTAAFALDFSAEIVDVYGQALITPKATGKAVAAAKGMKLAPGDALETKAKAELELLYDDGNITRIDEKTKLTITRMSVEDDKSKQTLLNLAVGRVKNSVSKLSHEKSKFEVQTTSAVAGVTGTPPWVVAAIGEPGKKQKVEVDLLPEKPGAANHTAGVFVKGTDPGATKVTLTPGTGTFALAGKPPVMPAPIPPAKLQQLQTAMKIATPPQVQEQKKKELEQKIEEKKEEKKEEPKKEEKKEEEKKEEKKDKEETKKEEEKKTEEKKGEEKKEEVKKEDSGKKEESKQEESKKEDTKQETSKEDSSGGKKESAGADNKETKTDTATGGDSSKAADTGGSKTDASTAGTSSGGTASSTADGAGASTVSAGGASTASGTASSSTPDVTAKAVTSPSVAPSTTAPSAPSAGAFSGGFTGGGTTGAAGPADTSGMMNHLTSNVSVGNTVPGTTASTAGDATGAAALPGANQNTLPAAMTKVRVLVTITNK